MPSVFASLFLVKSFVLIFCVGDKISIIFYPKCNHCKTIDWGFRNVLILCHIFSRYPEDTNGIKPYYPHTFLFLKVNIMLYLIYGRWSHHVETNQLIWGTAIVLKWVYWYSFQPPKVKPSQGESMTKKN